MTLAGDFTRVECDVSPEAQELSIKLYTLACNEDGRAAEVDTSRGAQLADLRRAEIAVINEKLMTDPPYIGWDYNSFNEDSLVILDCPRANGGICVINVWDDTFVHVTSFRPTKPHQRDQILIQPWILLQDKDSNYTSEGELREEVLEAATIISLLRYLFDNPQVGQTVQNAISAGANILLNPFSP